MRRVLWVLGALAGVVLAAGVSYAASSLSTQRVGLSAEPPSAGAELAPAARATQTPAPPKRTPTPRPKRTPKPRRTPVATPTTVPVPTAAPTVDDQGGGGDDSGGHGHSGGSGGHGADD
jgi:hypothetical protein